MKEIHNLTNNLIQEFQDCMESKLIEVMKMKMLPIQFLSGTHSIQIYNELKKPMPFQKLNRGRIPELENLRTIQGSDCHCLD
jgi:hypothetical protein